MSDVRRVLRGIVATIALLSPIQGPAAAPRSVHPATTVAVATTPPEPAVAPAAQAQPFAERADAIAASIKARRYAEAADAARALLLELEKAGQAESIESARALDLLVEASWRGGLRDAARREDAERAAAIRASKLGPDDPSVATSLHLLANLLQSRGDDAAARAFYEKSLAIREKAFGPDAIEIVPSLNNLGSVTLRLGDLAASRRVLERALAIRQKKLDPTDRDLARSHINLTNTLNALGDYAEAEKQSRRAVEILETRPEDDMLPSALNSLGNSLIEQGRPEEAEPFLRRAVQREEELLGPDDPFLAMYTGNLATARRDQGDFVEARRLQERALRIHEAKGDAADRAQRALLLNNLGHLFIVTGDPYGAKSILERALEIRRSVLPSDHPDIAQTLTNLGHVAWLSQDVPSARARYSEAAAILERTVGPRHLAYGSVLNMQGRMSQEEGRYEEARRCYDQFVSIATEALGPDSPGTALALTQAAAAHSQFGELAEAIRTYETALAIQEKSLGPHHVETARTLQGLARCLAVKGEQDRALALALRAEAIGRELIVVTIPALPERQAFGFIADRPTGLFVAMSIAARSRHTEVIRGSWDALVRARGLAQSEMARRLSAVRQGSDEETKRLEADLTAARSRLLHLYLQTPRRERVAEYRSSLDAARREAELAERALAEASSAGKRPEDTSRTGLAEVASALPPNAALVAYAHYVDVMARPGSAAGRVTPPDDRAGAAGAGKGASSRAASGNTAEDSGAYLAFVLPPGKRDPIVVPLGHASLIDAAIRAWRKEVTSPAFAGARPGSEASYRRAAEALRRVVWDPIRARVSGARTVFVVPDGMLHLVSFQTLPDGRKGYLVEKGPTLHLLPSERELVRARAGDAEGRGLLALGAPDFDAAPAPDGTGESASGPVQEGPVQLGQARPDPGTIGATEDERDAEQNAAPRDAEGNALASGDATFEVSRLRSAVGASGRARFEPLPGARGEVSIIRDVWNAGSRKEEDAVEITPTGVRQLTRSSQDLHILG
jgi:tetratricopeptide (TPR) repeat protein